MINKKNGLLWFCALFVSLNSVSLIAETAYVNDRLFLGVYAEPSSEQSAIHTLSSGSTVEVLEKQETFTKVLTTTGVEGWVRTRFISTDKPASTRVKEVEVERDQLAAQLKLAPSDKELKTLRSQLTEARKKVTSLENEKKAASNNNVVDVQQIDTLKAELETSELHNSKLEKEISELQLSQKTQAESRKAKSASSTKRLEWYWYLLIIASLFLSGVILGATLLARRVRRRFNGIKVW